VSRITIIQAHMASSRLPKKVMMDICGESMLQRVEERCIKADAPVKVATTVSPSDDVIADNFAATRGTEKNVLDRFWGTAHHDFIARVTSDCPLIDPCMIDKAFSVLESSGVALVGYQIQTKINALGYMDGMDVEVFTREALNLANANATEAYDLEHVTTWMKRNLDCITIRPGKKYPYVKLSVDTAEDLERVRKVYKAMLWHKPDFSVDDVGLYLRGLGDGKG